MATENEVLLAWNELRLVVALASGAINRALDAEGVGLAEASVLLRLAATQSGQLRMGELAGRLAMVQSGITRVIGRLEERGWVERVQPRDNRRTIYATLTVDGRAALERIRPVYERAVDEQFGRALSPEEAGELRGLLRQVLNRLGWSRGAVERSGAEPTREPSAKVQPESTETPADLDG
ncbi:MAG TPA: MarR family transcriptional regulator [Candidatus Saccharimonadales bacterium]|nr:MarR family transcriptional regulator [Candidatus Saccharimonadales bacterium]